MELPEFSDNIYISVIIYSNKDGYENAFKAWNKLVANSLMSLPIVDFADSMTTPINETANYMVFNIAMKSINFKVNNLKQIVKQLTDYAYEQIKEIEKIRMVCNEKVRHK